MNTENIENDPLHPTNPPLTTPVTHRGHHLSADEFSDNEDQFILMTPAATQSEIVAFKTVGNPSGFKKVMLNLLGDRLRKVPRNFQIRSLFQSTTMRPKIPCSKALALKRKIEHDSHLER
jgi:hypothetical protein